MKGQNNMCRKLKTAGVMLASAMIVTALHASPTPLQTAVTDVGETATEITGSTVAGAVVAAGLGLFAIRFGVPWVIRLFKSTSK